MSDVCVSESKARNWGYSFSFYFLLLAILLNPYNAVIFSGLRMNDLMLIGGLIAFFFQSHWPKRTLFIFAVYLCVLIFSTLSGAILGELFESIRVIFIYKYSLLILLPSAFCGVLSSHFRVKLMARSLYGAYLFLVGWVFYYKAAVDGGAIIGLTRLSFPGSDSFLSSDAHLYSSYLSTMLLGYIFFLGKEFRHSFWKVAVILVLSIAALLLTGSRNGLLGVGVGLLVYFFLLLSGSVAIKLQNFLRIIAVCVFVMVIIYMSWAEFVTYADELLIRATSFDGLQDESGLGRIAKAGVAVEEVLDSNVFFGLGVFSASLIWYDGALSIAFAHFGLLGG